MKNMVSNLISSTDIDDKSFKSVSRTTNENIYFFYHQELGRVLVKNAKFDINDDESTLKAY